MKPGISFDEGAVFRAGGNNPFLITGCDDAWYIVAGNVDVFAVAIADGEPTGRRRHLFRVTSGALIFGVSRKEEEHGFGLIAVGGPGTRLARLTPARIGELAAGDLRTEFTQAADAWIKAVSNAMPPLHLPKREETVPFDEKEVPGGGPAAMIANGRFLVQPPGQGIPASLHDFHACFLAYVREKIDSETVREGERLRQKKEINRRAIESAFSSLTGAMGARKRQAAADTDGSPLLAACRLVAQAMGCTVRLASHGREKKGGTLNDIARASRIRIRRIALRGNWWREDNGPILAFSGDDEKPVALLPDASLRYEVIDPADNGRVPLTAERAATIAPFGYVFYPPFPDRTIMAIDLLKLGLKNCRTRDIVMICLMGLAAGILGMITPVATGVIFDAIIPGAEKVRLIQLAVVLLVIAFSSSLFELTRNLAVFRVETRMGVSVQAGVWDRLLSLPVPFFRRFLAGDLALRSLGIETIRQMLTSATVSSILSALFAVFNLLLLFYYEWQLALVAIVLVFIAAAVMMLTGTLELRYQRFVQKIQGSISGMVFQFVTGIAKLRVAGAEERAFAAWARAFSEQKRYSYKARSISSGLAVFNSAFPVITSAIIFAVAAWVMSKGNKGATTLSTGDFLAFNAAFGQFLATGLEMGSILISILEIVPIYERAKPIMEAMPEVDMSKADPGELRGDIEISHVSFRYQHKSPLVLNDVSLQICPGEFVAIVGPSGAGKSTVLRLLLGFETPESGSIHFDGQDFATLDVQNVRRQMGVVLQNGQVMPGSILENIVGTSPLTLDDAWEAARLAGFDGDIERMPMGMYTFVPEGGSTFSGGQKQRLLIARAIVNRPKILLFDEATSALDNETQAQVSRSLERLNVTRVVIAHRLSTIMNAHRIYVLENGRVVQAGSYEELIKQEDCLFAELAKRQMA